MDSKTYPHCQLINPESAVRCDCGFDFQSQEMEESYATARYNPEVLSLWSWFGLIFLMYIPLVNLIVGLHFARTGNGSLNRRNFCRAMLIFIVFGYIYLFIALMIVIFEGSL